MDLVSLNLISPKILTYSLQHEKTIFLNQSDIDYSKCFRARPGRPGINKIEPRLAAFVYNEGFNYARCNSRGRFYFDIAKWK